jgi:regulator of RNase E activity RraB
MVAKLHRICLLLLLLSPTSFVAANDVNQALQHEARTAENKKRDAARKPEQNENTSYLIIAKCTMILELNTLIKLSEQFETLAEQYEIIYDGWGAEIIK